ncbi:MAG: tRNA1(Val) (adenine(37)-N6)-methyltransferase [Lachnospiraceae bacterium]|nr:tRNA1(Val) (adenine(37)-N6)-methyltransferase [Lachnospiraceae bacterium]
MQEEGKRLSEEELRACGLLKPEERLDDLQRNHCRIIQNTGKFCFGMDAVLLSGFAKVKDGERVLDLGTGTGIIPILLEAKTNGRHFTALEIQEESADMARRSVRINGQQDKIEVVTGDIREASGVFGAASFDVVTTNPPYMNNSHGLVNPDMPKAIARHELLCSLEDVIREAAKVLKPNGRFYMVHRPFRLVQIIRLMAEYKLEPKRMKLVQPYQDKEPNMVLIEGLKGGGANLKVEPPLVVYREPGVYTDEIYDIYGY